MKLPRKRSKKKTELKDFTILVHGEPKIGKSTLCAGADEAVFLATEQGLNSLEVFQVPIATWEDMLNACKELSEGKHNFQTIIIDTIDNAYKLCSIYVCKLHNILHESDLPYGKGFAATNGEFLRVLTKLSLLPYGLIMISHSKEVEIKTRSTDRIKIVPTLTGKACEIVTGIADIILYCDFDIEVDDETGEVNEKRVLRTQASDKYVAGDRTGLLPATIEMSMDIFKKSFKKGE